MVARSERFLNCLELGPAKLRGAGHKNTKNQVAQMRIVVVDDDLDLLAETCECLTLCNYAVSPHASGHPQQPWFWRRNWSGCGDCRESYYLKGQIDRFPSIFVVF